MHKQSVVKIGSGEATVTRRLGGEVRVLLGPRTVDATAGFMGTIDLQPGEFLAEQYNPYSDKFCYLVRGSVMMRVDGEKVDLLPDDALMVRRGQRHRIENHGAEPAFLVFQVCPLAPRPELGHVDTEEMPNPDEPVPLVGGPGATKPTPTTHQ